MKVLPILFSILFVIKSNSHGESPNQNLNESKLASYWQQVKGEAFNGTGVEVTYYISADEVIWDYAPDGYNLITGKEFNTKESNITQTGPGRIGSKYLKCLFREYTDESFKSVKNRSREEEYLGFLGPIIQAEVGDTIKVLFRNKCRFNASIHPHGVLYRKDSEGSLYNDETNSGEKIDDNIPLDGQHLYVWYVNERAGPGPSDGTSIVWPYQSDVDHGITSDTGAMGFISITAKGFRSTSYLPIDVDQQVFHLFSVTNEKESPYYEYNMKNFAYKGSNNTGVDMERDMNMDMDGQNILNAPMTMDGEMSSDQIHNINGYIYGNGPLLEIKSNTHVRWIIASGNSFHSAHWHGNVVTTEGRRADVVGISPMQTKVLDMVPDNIGVWSR